MASGDMSTYSLDSRPGAFEPSPKGLQDLDAFASTDEDYGSRPQVQDDGQIAVAFAGGDLIQRDWLELSQLGSGESPLEVSLPDLFDDVPTDVEMVGHIQHGHGAAQLPSVSLKSFRVGL